MPEGKLDELETVITELEGDPIPGLHACLMALQENNFRSFHHEPPVARVARTSTTPGVGVLLSDLNTDVLSAIGANNLREDMISVEKNVRVSSPEGNAFNIRFNEVQKKAVKKYASTNKGDLEVILRNRNLNTTSNKRVAITQFNTASTAKKAAVAPDAQDEFTPNFYKILLGREACNANGNEIWRPLTDLNPFLAAAIKKPAKSNQILIIRIIETYIHKLGTTKDDQYYDLHANPTSHAFW